jgi:hypothetical protein
MIETSGGMGEAALRGKVSRWFDRCVPAVSAVAV